MKKTKRRAPKKSISQNDNNKISLQEIDEEKWICIQTEAYYRAMKRIEAEKEIKQQYVSTKRTVWQQILYIINFFLFPFIIFGKIKIKKGVYNLPIIFAISFIMELVGGISWGVGLFGIPFLVITGKLPHDITIIAVSIIMVFIGSMLIIGVKDFEREEDNNKIYAFASSFLALASLCVSIVTLLVGKI